MLISTVYIIVTSCSEQVRELINNCSIPVIALDAKLHSADVEACIYCDYYWGGRIATEHLVENGCKHIVCIKGPQYRYSARSRYQGYSDVCRELGIEERTVECDYDFNQGKQGGNCVMKKVFALVLCLALVMSMAGCVRIVIDGEESSVQISANGTIGLSVSTQNNPFFVSLVEGAEKQAAALGVKITVADAGDDAAKQTSDIEDLVASGISVLIVNPVDSDAVTGAVEFAKSKGVKVISVDRAVNGTEIDCQIASDNVLGAELATQFIVDTLGEGAVVAELEGVTGASAAIDRSQGFHNVADAKLQVVARQTANFARAEGMSVMENMLQANPDIQGVFAANDEMALGAMEAISGAGKNVMVVGFDATDDAIESIKAGQMAGTIAQQPDLIGSTAVEYALKLIAGESIPKSVPVEVTLITKDNA